MTVLKVIYDRNNGIKSRFNLEANTHSITLRTTQTPGFKDQSVTSHGPENDEKRPLSCVFIPYGGIDFACLPQDQDISFDACNSNYSV